jgi:hypothetical protein
MIGHNDVEMSLMSKGDDNKTVIEEGFLGAESDYERKTDREIRELALGIRSGTVFGSWMIPEHQSELLANVFMPLVFLNDIQRKSLIRNKVTQFYGYLKDAAPRSINGMPMFFAMHMLDAEDCTRLNASLKKLEDFVGKD